MSMTLYDAPAANTYVVRLFILERGSLSLDTHPVDIFSMENRKPWYKTNVNPCGELPALRVTDPESPLPSNSPGGGFVLTEITAVCEYLDELAGQHDGGGDKSLFGKTPLERAETRMWLRRMDLEIAQPVISWYRNDPETLSFYRGARLPTPEARLNQKVQIMQALNMLDDQLEGKRWLCGDRFSAADVHLYGLVKPMLGVAEWVDDEARTNVRGWFQRMEGREKSKVAFEPFQGRVEV